MSLSEFWQQVYIAAVRSGASAGVALQKADDALSDFKVRFSGAVKA